MRKAGRASPKGASTRRATITSRSPTRSSPLSKPARRVGKALGLAEGRQSLHAVQCHHRHPLPRHQRRDAGDVAAGACRRRPALSHLQTSRRPRLASKKRRSWDDSLLLQADRGVGSEAERGTRRGHKDKIHPAAACLHVIPRAPDRRYSRAHAAECRLSAQRRRAQSQSADPRTLRADPEPRRLHDGAARLVARCRQRAGNARRETPIAAAARCPRSGSSAHRDRPRRHLAPVTR